jgi:sortase A
MRAVNVAASVLFATGISLLAYVTYVAADAHAFQKHARSELAVSAGRPVPARRALREGDLLGEIHSARIGLRAVIVEGESDGILARGVGHIAGTATPGEPGNVGLAAHRDTFFRPLRNIRVGDVITVTAGGRETNYAVEWTVIVSPDVVTVLEPTDGRTLTLVTCHPFEYVGNAPNRFIVRARERQ